MDEAIFKMYCPYCKALWDADMETDLCTAGDCPTCGSYVEGSIEIFCHNCKKLVYKKEI